MSKFKRLVIKEKEMLVRLNTGGNDAVYAKVLVGEEIYDKEGNEVGEVFFSKSLKGNNKWGYWFKEQKNKPTVEYVPNDKRLRKELGID